MGRKTKITKEMILEAAYELLDESGIGAVAIKTIAAKLECSTQPISWQFGSMTDLKKELFNYAVGKLYGNLPDKMKGKEATEAFFISGVHYLTNVYEHPNVFRFINVDNTMDTIGEDIRGENSFFDYQFDEEAVEFFEQQYDVPKDAIREAVRDTVIYTHGLAMFAMLDGAKLSREDACKLMFNMGMKLLANLGIKQREDIDYYLNI
ncbi:transcriptional regulator, TetR family [Lachnospiraceae bacterium G11]|nr:transcriptional regulator, TetR family [Lachnospiraceae bacterium G11]